MGRPARYISENKNGVLVEVSCRAIGGRALLTPGPNPFKLNELVAGVMGRALEVSPLDLCCAIFSSNHYHLLAVVHEQQQLTRFMAHLACNLSKAIGRLRGWRGAMWERRYDAIVVGSDAEWARLKHSLNLLHRQQHRLHSTRMGVANSLVTAMSLSYFRLYRKRCLTCV